MTALKEGQNCNLRRFVSCWISVGIVPVNEFLYRNNQSVKCIITDRDSSGLFKWTDDDKIENVSDAREWEDKIKRWPQLTQCSQQSNLSRDGSGQ